MKKQETILRKSCFLLFKYIRYSVANFASCTFLVDEKHEKTEQHGNAENP